MDDTAPPDDRQVAALRMQIPPEEYAILQDYYQTRLQQAMQQAQAAGDDSIMPPDAADVEARLLATLEREADGLDHPHGLGAVPTTNGVQRITIPLDDPRTLPAAKATQRQRRAASAGRVRTPQEWLILAVLVIAGLWCVGQLWGAVAGDDPAPAAVAEPTRTTPFTGTVPLATATPLVSMSGGEAVEVFYPTSLDIDQDDAAPLVYRVLASSSELGGQWQPSLTDGTAAWLNGTYINPVLCLPPTAQAWAAELQRGAQLTLRPASGALRRYEVVRVRAVGRQEVDVLDQRRAGLTLVVCGTGGNERTIMEAIHRPELVQAATATLSQTVQLSDLARVTVQTIQPVTQTTPTAPDMQALALVVEVENVTRVPLHPADLLDQLTLPAAVAELLPAERLPIAPQTSGTWQYHYLAPASGGTATWSLTDLTGDTIRVQLSLPAQPAPTLHATLDAGQSQVMTEANGFVVTLPLTVTAQGGIAQLTPDQLSAWSGNRALSLSTSPALPLSIAPNQPAALTITVTVPDVRAFDLHLGRQRFRVSLP